MTFVVGHQKHRNGTTASGWCSSLSENIRFSRDPTRLLSRRADVLHHGDIQLMYTVIENEIVYFQSVCRVKRVKTTGNIAMYEAWACKGFFAAQKANMHEIRVIWSRRRAPDNKRAAVICRLI